MTFRLDRMATLYVASPMRRLTPGNEPSVPILMYHSIADEDESQVRAYYRTATAPKVFAAQMKHLYESSYRTVSLGQAIDHLQAGIPGTTKPVVITFDDGLGDFYRQAFPELDHYGFSATVFLPTAYISDSPMQFKGKDCLTWAEVRELQKHGVAFGSHTVTHPQLRGLSAHAIDEEIVNSKQTIEEKLGCAVDSFAYPFAFPQTEVEFTSLLRDSLRQAGYRNGACTVVGRAGNSSDPFFLPRLPINSCDDAALFQAKLEGAYDWIAKPQRLVKLAKSRAARLCWQS